MSKFILKVKTKSGQHVVDSLKLTNTVIDLKNLVSPLVNISVSNMNILCGFPPKNVESIYDNKTLEEVKIVSGDTIIVEESKVKNSALDVSAQRHLVQDHLGDGLLMRQVVPADNSCLFTSIGFVLGGKIDTTSGSYMRRIIAEQVSNDEEKFSEAILGMSNNKYCKWIIESESWGGAIELAVLSNYYGIEIAVVDTMNGVINRFGEDRNYDYRVFLIFDGIHYDPVYRESLQADGTIQTLFLTTDEKALKQAEELALEAKSSKQYTDVNRFSLQCLVCRQQLTGQSEAQKHAQSTGHMNFGEIST